MPESDLSSAEVGEPGIWFHKVIEAAHEGIGIIDREGRLTYVNPRLADMVGYTVDEVLGRKFFEFHADAPPEAGEARLEQRRAGIGESYEVRLRHKNGSDVWVLMNANPILNDRKEFVASLGMVFDITRRRTAEIALRESEERFRLAVENSPDLMFYQDANLRFTWISKTIPPGREQTVLGLTDFDVIEHGQASVIVEAKKRVLETGGTERLENQVEIEGKTYHFQTDVVRRVDAEGRALGLAGYVRDVTASKLAEQALIELNRTLEQKVAERTESLGRQTQILHSILDGMSDGVLVSDETGKLILHNQALVRMAGAGDSAPSADLQKCAARMSFYKSDGATPYAGHDLPLARAVGGERVEDEETCVRREGMDDHWLSVSATPLRDEQGRIKGAVAVSRDVTERRRAAEAVRLSEAHHRELAEHNRLLVQEVEHRVGNNLAGLLGLVTIMRSRTRDVDAFADAFESRLRAMAHVHQLLTNTGWNSMALRDMVASALGALREAASHPTEETLDGPGIEVAAWHVQPLTLILLELYTNSCKYGAHSIPGGKLRIHWSIDDQGTGGKIRLYWRERNGPPIKGPVTPSLGTQLIRSFTGKELKGRIEMNFPAEGAEHMIEFPIEK